MRPTKKPDDSKPRFTPKPQFFGGMVPVDQLPDDHPEKVREREEQEKEE